MSEIENGRLGLYGIVEQLKELGFKGLMLSLLLSLLSLVFRKLSRDLRTR